MGNNGMSEQGRIFPNNNGSSVGSSYELLNLKKPCFFLSFFATELSYLVDIFSPCSKDDCVGSLFRTYLHRSILWDQHLYFLIKYFNFLF